ncbi:MAG: nitrilase-related carbon-nitrogen hydrolase, partial [Bacteroidota bacterium]
MHREGKQTITIGLAQIAPVWLNRQATTDKIIQYIAEAGEQGCSLVVFGEAFLPGYPFWLSFTGGAQFDDSLQKEWHAHYMQEAVQISQGDLAIICQACKAHHIATIVGCIELAKDRGHHSLYCSLVYIDATGNIAYIHRMIVPTYEERLSWSPGDG